MKRINIVLIFVFIPYFCFTQNNSEELDSVILISRERVDKIIHAIDAQSSFKLFYSIKDLDYLVIIKDGHSNVFKEFYVQLNDTGEIINICRLEIKKEKTFIFKKAFNLDLYHSGFITKIPDAKILHGYSSYFVVIDDKGQRYGEYNLPALTLPNPIDNEVYIYLSKRIAEVIK